MRAAGVHHFKVVQSPIAAAKALKNKCVCCECSMRGLMSPAHRVELQGQREGYLTDAVAWCRFIAHLMERLHRGDKVQEYEAAQMFLRYAEQGKDWFEVS